MTNVIYNMYQNKRYELVSQKLPKARSIKILDVGCGNGAPSLIYARHHKVQVVAFDITHHSNWKAIKKDRLIDFLVADANYLPFRVNSFDAVTMTEVLEHLDDDVTCLKSVNKKLKDKGILIVTTPNGARITSILARMSIFRKKVMKIGLKPGDHRREYSPFELRKILSKSGFRLQWYSYVSFCPYLPLFRKISEKRALRLFNLLDNVFNSNPLAPLFRWCLIAVSVRCKS